MKAPLFLGPLLLSGFLFAQGPSSQPAASQPVAPVQPVQVISPPKVTLCYDCKTSPIIERVYFSKGSAAPLKSSRVVLDAVAQLLQENPQIVKVSLIGHADPTTEGLYAEKISLRRANAAREYLISLGVDPARLEVQSQAARLPLNVGKSAKDRAQNRRVELFVVSP